mmetsp:Transcript_19363/g.61395  ORF Transcript_19363/g.61395 Transcript_19363/m.61395 type:complete len:489 (-) Transcript_19363:310-1776(-)
MAQRGTLLILSGLQAAGGVPIGGAVGQMLPTELPGSGFPGPTAAQSHMAWPISHRQPGRYDAWPQLGYGTPSRTLLPCWRRFAIKDHDSGWPGACMSLMQAKRYSSEDGCRSFCWSEPRCAVWQFVNQTNPSQCWVGFGEHCVWRDGKASALSVQGAQRIMHGAVRVLKKLAGWKINNLYNIGMYHAGDEKVSINRCKAWCYSDISCQYWQYGPGGCWVDAPRWSTAQGNDVNNRVQYPLTTDGGASNTSSEALTMMWGEYIQHYCPPRRTTPTPMQTFQTAPRLPSLMQTTAAPSASMWSEWWPWCLAALATCLCGAACAYAVVAGQGQGVKKSSKSNRSGRIAMSDYGDEDSPLVSPPRRRPSPADDLQAAPAAPPAPTMEYLNADQSQDYQQWPQQPAPPPRPQNSGGMPETQNLAARRQTNLMHAPPETARATPQQGMAPPTQMVDTMQSPQAMYGGRPYQQGGTPFPAAGGQRQGFQTVQGGL